MNHTAVSLINESPVAKRAELLRKRYDDIQQTIDQRRPGSRVWKLSNVRVYGTDANDRKARTSKMNMILHVETVGCPCRPKSAQPWPASKPQR